VSDNGLVAGHAYSILDVKEVNGHQLIQCRNPWGQGEWNGMWSDDNNFGEWTEEMCEAVGKTFGDDGKFWMSIEDFVENTSGAEYARTFGPNWWKTTHYGRFKSEKVLALAKRNVSAKNDGEISFSKGDEIEVMEFADESWWKGMLISTGEVGFFPDESVDLKDRPVERFDLVGSVNAGTDGPMTVVVMLMQANVMRKRKYFQRKADGMNYKDLTYGRITLIVVHPDGSVACRKDSNERCLWTELQLPGGGQWRIYALSAEGKATEFTLRAYVKDGSCSLRSIPGASMDELEEFL